MEYRERLWVPAAWWVIGLFFAVSFVTAVGFYFGPWVSVVAGVLTGVGVIATLLWHGSILVRVDEQGVKADGAVLEWAWLGTATALDAAATRRRLGPGADHRAHLIIRGYITTAVELTVNDPDDAHPYWLVSTRRPRELVQAIEEARARMPR
ncbi:MAG: DUF3093 domain-containing protein [Propionibacteriaceae bacterium]|nr:DUF3093 domain-containing protein [Propionibacteriaceae bacterium]